jgi:hypothetical protein
MENFIKRMIAQQADISLSTGQEKYRAYFINTSIYEKYKKGVDTLLKSDGYSKVIVKS